MLTSDGQSSQRMISTLSFCKFYRTHSWSFRPEVLCLLRVGVNVQVIASSLVKDENEHSVASGWRVSLKKKGQSYPARKIQVILAL